jgi:hypothetical protein
MKMVEVFKTNVCDQWSAGELVELLCLHFPGCAINFDLEDCDKVLRIEGDHFFTDGLKKIVREKGFWCEVLE